MWDEDVVTNVALAVCADDVFTDGVDVVWLKLCDADRILDKNFELLDFCTFDKLVGLI